jgi:hypothetical protein
MHALRYQVNEVGMGLLKKSPQKPLSAALLKATQDADTFVRAARERNAADKEYQLAKSGLKEWLGDATTKNLPDGRTVTLSVAPRAGYTTEPGVTATLTVGPPPAP